MVRSSLTCQLCWLCIQWTACELQSRQGLGTGNAAPAGAPPPGVDAATLAHIQGVAAAAGITSIGTSAPAATAAAAGNDALTAAGGWVARHVQHCSDRLLQYSKASESLDRRLLSAGCRSCSPGGRGSSTQAWHGASAASARRKRRHCQPRQSRWAGTMCMAPRQA